MNDTHWTKEELKAYVFIYCANADFEETEDEREVIEDKIAPSVLEKMEKIYKEDSDFQKIEKIRKTVEYLNLSNEQLDTIFNDAKEIFMADGEFDILEQNLLRQLKKHLK